MHAKRTVTRLESGIRGGQAHTRLRTACLSNECALAASRFANSSAWEDGPRQTAKSQLLRVFNAEFGTEYTQARVECVGDGADRTPARRDRNGCALLACGPPRLVTVERRGTAPKEAQALPRKRPVS